MVPSSGFILSPEDLALWVRYWLTCDQNISRGGRPISPSLWNDAECDWRLWEMGWILQPLHVLA